MSWSLDRWHRRCCRPVGGHHCCIRKLGLVIITLGLVLFYRAYIFAMVTQGGDKEETNLSLEVSGCSCWDPVTRRHYNFCYQLPTSHDSPPVFGKRFNCDHLESLRNLGLLNPPSHYWNVETQSLPPTVVFVSACTKTFRNEMKRMVRSLKAAIPTAKIIVYNLGGWDAPSMEEMEETCGMEMRNFSYHLYSDSMQTIAHYRWKPIVIAEMLKEFNAVWYMDGSIVWKPRGHYERVYDLIRCSHDQWLLNRPQLFNISASLSLIRRWISAFLAFFHPRPEETKFPEEQSHAQMADPSLDPAWLERGFHPEAWQGAVHRCDKFPLLLMGWTGHGIFSATRPEVYEYLPANLTLLKQRSSRMYEAGLLFTVRSAEVVNKVLKWFVLCALEEDCLAPMDSDRVCHFYAGDRFGIRASPVNCHRFDQSILNLLLANANHYHSYYWSSQIVDFFTVNRENFYSQNPGC